MLAQDWPERRQIGEQRTHAMQAMGIQRRRIKTMSQRLRQLQRQAKQFSTSRAKEDAIPSIGQPFSQREKEAVFIAGLLFRRLQSMQLLDESSGFLFKA